MGEARADRLLWDGPPHGFIFPNLFLGELNVARSSSRSVSGQTVHRHTVVQFDGVDDAFNRRLLRQSEAALGPASFIVPDDAVTPSACSSRSRGGRRRLAATPDGLDRPQPRPFARADVTPDGQARAAMSATR